MTAADEENLIFPVGQFLEKFGKPGRWRGTGEVTWWAREKVREMDKGKVLVGEERSDTQMSALSDNELISEFLTGQLCVSVYSVYGLCNLQHQQVVCFLIILVSY